MNAEELEKIKRDSFDVWFERFWNKVNLKERLKQSAMKGYTGYKIQFSDNEYENRRMRDPRFVKLLKERLPSLKINYRTMTNTTTFMGLKNTKTTEWIEFNWESDNDGS